MRASSVEQRGHQVRLGGSLLADPAQRGLDVGGVAAGADALDAVDLLALQGRVDAQDLDLAVAALGERLTPTSLRSPLP